MTKKQEKPSVEQFEEVKKKIQKNLQEIASTLDSSYRITLIARNTQVDDADILLTNETDMQKAAESFKKMIIKNVKMAQEIIKREEAAKKTAPREKVN